MTMNIQFLIVAAAVCLSLAQDLPRYKESVDDVKEAIKAIETHVLSMEGDIPFLEDYRRHYLVIVHVINYHAFRRSGCVVKDYYDEYYPYLNISAPEGYSKPGKVLGEIRTFLDVFYNKTNKIIALVDSCEQPWTICDLLISDTVKENEDEFGIQAKILLTSGKVASEFNDLSYEIEYASGDVKGLHFVTTSPEELEYIVNALAVLYQQLYTYTNVYSTPTDCN